MIIHCTKKLSAKLNDVSPEPLSEDSPLGSWHGHLMRFDRRQCVMFCHDPSRYVLFLAGLRKKQFEELGEKWFRQLYLASLATLSLSELQLRKVELALGRIRFDSATDRSVLSSLSVAQQDFEAMLYEVPNVMNLDPLAVAHWLNERPVTIYGEWLWPAQAMQERIAAL